MRVAVIDLGTNTCNLLIADIDQKGFDILHQSKQWVKLGDSQIKSNEISHEGLDRILFSLEAFRKIVENHGAEVIRIVATSAIRHAQNRVEILETIGKRTGWIIKIIPGEDEARLIFQGVLLALEKIETPSVIMDIGGGSNELILAEKDSIIWKESKHTGMARVINQFALSDPLHPEELEILKAFFTARHASAIEECKKNGVETLIGCSGAFDTLADMIEEVSPGTRNRRQQQIRISDFCRIYDKLLFSTLTERKQMKGMDMMRVHLIVPAVIFIHQFMAQTGIKTIIQTDFALREGVLYEIREQDILPAG